MTKNEELRVADFLGYINKALRPENRNKRSWTKDPFSDETGADTAFRLTKYYTAWEIIKKTKLVV